MAVHHILPWEIKDRPLFQSRTAEDWMESRAFGRSADVYVAHNSKFEQAFLPGFRALDGSTPAKWICTYKAALRIWPEAPAHTNQTLLYWLGLHNEIDEDRRHPPHRALPDAYVTAHILCRLLQKAIAALYVETGGAYYGLDGIDPWDQVRDARLYDGPHPVVAHPPCPRWGKMWFGQPLTVKLTGRRKSKGSDAGCFGSALTATRNFGGVLEHPWGSHAWPWFGLAVPPRAGGWIKADQFGGWTCCVEQGRYGHYARKPTLLYAVGADLPELDWGESEARYDPAVVERMGLKRAKRLGEVGARGGGTDSSPRIHTPEPFRDLLIGMARSVRRDELPLFRSAA